MRSTPLAMLGEGLRVAPRRFAVLAQGLTAPGYAATLKGSGRRTSRILSTACGASNKEHWEGKAMADSEHDSDTIICMGWNPGVWVTAWRRTPHAEEWDIAVSGGPRNGPFPTLEYATWDGIGWEAYWDGNNFIHRRKGEPDRHSDTINYKAIDGRNWQAKWQTSNNQFHHKPS